MDFDIGDRLTIRLEGSPLPFVVDVADVDVPAQTAKLHFVARGTDRVIDLSCIRVVHRIEKGAPPRRAPTPTQTTLDVTHRNPDHWQDQDPWKDL